MICTEVAEAAVEANKEKIERRETKKKKLDRRNNVWMTRDGDLSESLFTCCFLFFLTF